MTNISTLNWYESDSEELDNQKKYKHQRYPNRPTWIVSEFPAVRKLVTKYEFYPTIPVCNEFTTRTIGRTESFVRHQDKNIVEHLKCFYFGDKFTMEFYFEGYPVLYNFCNIAELKDYLEGVIYDQIQIQWRE